MTASTLCPPANDAHADDTHHQDYPLGSRAVGLGGAFTALGSDASGIFYNPAGLVDASRNSVSISSNLYGVEIAVEENLFAAVGESLIDIEGIAAELNIIPNSAGYVGTSETRDHRGRHVHSYGWGVFVPSFRGVSVQTSTPDKQYSYRRDLLDREFHSAAAYAYRFAEDWSFGISAVANFRQLKDFEENTSLESNGDFNIFTTSQTSLKAIVGTTMLTVGLKNEFAPSWFLGIAITTPGIEFYDFAQFRVLKTRTVTGNTQTESSFSLDEPDNVQSSFSHGGHIRLGVARIFPRKLTLSADAVFYAPISYELIKLPTNRSDLMSEITIATSIRRNFIGNVNVGAEYLLSDRLSLSGGVFTNLSTSDPIPGAVGGSLDRDYLPHVNEYGMSGVFGYFTEHTLTRLGAMLTYGNGADVIPQDDTFRKISKQSIYLYVFLSSTFRY
ncbi:MAG: hypothetical protein VYC39_00550 [Myxococcota bacterium]|nr:hypothetical protein [Myxococcota bacterium]